MVGRAPKRCRFFFHNSYCGRRVCATGLRRFGIGVFLFGTWWGALPVLFFSGATSAAQVVITCLCAGMIAGAIVWVEGAVNLPVAILIVSYAITLFRTVLAHAFEFTQRFRSTMLTCSALIRPASGSVVEGPPKTRRSPARRSPNLAAERPLRHSFTPRGRVDVMTVV